MEKRVHSPLQKSSSSHLNLINLHREREEKKDNVEKKDLHFPLFNYFVD